MGRQSWSPSLSWLAVNLSASLYFPSSSICWALLTYRSDTSSTLMHVTASCKHHSREGP